MVWPRASLSVLCMALGLVLCSALTSACTPEPSTEWNGTFINYAGLEDSPFCSHTGPYTLSSPAAARQHLHYRRGDTTQGSAPVFFYAHANGGKTPQLDQEELSTLVNEGYAVVSWESITKIETMEDTQTCWDDFELVLQWAVTNAQTLGFDVNRFVIGGRSRGTICSWKGAHSHSNDYKVAGIYMFNALPVGDDEAWLGSMEVGSGYTFPLGDVTRNSPPAYLLYGPDCPTTPPEATCDTKAEYDDGHNPWQGQKVVLRYESLGIGSKITLRDGCFCADNNVLQDFPILAAAIRAPADCPSAVAWACPLLDSSSARECASCVRANKHALLEAGCTRSALTDLCQRSEALADVFGSDSGVTAGGNSLDTESGRAEEVSASANEPVVELQLLPSETAPGGRCLDGTMAGYLVRQGDPDTFVIYLQGGGGCGEEVECKKRAMTEKGSSKTWTEDLMPNKQAIHTDCMVNPAFCNATHVYVPYCTGDGHRGNNTNPDETTAWGLYFDGHANFRAIVADLVLRYGLGAAKHALLTGGSAGAIGVYANADTLSDLLPGAAVKAAPNGGWYHPAALPEDLPPIFMPSDWENWEAGTHGNTVANNTNEARGYTMRYVWQSEGLLAEECVEAQEPDEWWACGSVHEAYKYIKTPLFVIDHQFDTNRIHSGAAVPTAAADDAEADLITSYYRMYGEASRVSMTQVVDGVALHGKPHPDGLFLASCAAHVVSDQLSVNGKTWLEIVGDWFYQTNELAHLHHNMEVCPGSSNGLPCNPSTMCAPEHQVDCKSNEALQCFRKCRRCNACFSSGNQCSGQAMRRCRRCQPCKRFAACLPATV